MSGVDSCSSSGKAGCTNVKPVRSPVVQSGDQVQATLNSSAPTPYIPITSPPRPPIRVIPPEYVSYVNEAFARVMEDPSARAQFGGRAPEEIKELLYEAAVKVRRNGRHGNQDSSALQEVGDEALRFLTFGLYPAKEAEAHPVIIFLIIAAAASACAGPDTCDAVVEKPSDIPVTDSEGDVPSVTEEYIYERLGRLPLELLQGICEVKLTALGAPRENGEHVAGEYQYPDGEIRLERAALHRVAQETPILFNDDKTIYHEVGHHIWRVILTEDEREEYGRIISRLPNAAELTADLEHTFIYDLMGYVMNPSIMRADQSATNNFTARYAFMKDRVFQGQEFLASTNPHFDETIASLLGETYYRGETSLTTTSSLENNFENFVRFTESEPTEEQVLYMMDKLILHGKNGPQDALPIVDQYFQALIVANDENGFIDPVILDFYYGWFLVVESLRPYQPAPGENTMLRQAGRDLLENVAQNGPTPNYRRAALILLNTF